MGCIMEGFGMACKIMHPATAGHLGKKAAFSLLTCNVLLALSGCAAGNVDTLQDSYKEEASACIFNGDSIEIEEIEEMEAIDTPIVDKWPESLSCISNGMTAQPYSVSIAIDEPMELSVSCIRDEGKIDMRITDAAGNVYFDEKKMQMDDYTVTIDKTGDYTVAFYAKAWYGKITIKPSE